MCLLVFLLLLNLSLFCRVFFFSFTIASFLQHCIYIPAWYDNMLTAKALNKLFSNFFWVFLTFFFSLFFSNLKVSLLLLNLEILKSNSHEE